MRKNEYNSLEEFTNQYVDKWGPSDGYYLGLDFDYNGKSYRMHTGAMYNEKRTILPDGREAVYALYELDLDRYPKEFEYFLLGEYADMEGLLESTVIEGRKFRDIIMDDNTEITGQD